MKGRLSRCGQLLLPVFALLVLWAPADAQRKRGGAPLPEDTPRLLEERGREALHPEPEPVTIVGIEQGDNDFRETTPLLSRGDRTTVLFDRDEAYRRRLNLYTARAVYRSPPAARGRVRANASGWEEAPSRAVAGVGPSQPRDPEHSRSWGQALLQGALLFVLVAVLLRRFYNGQTD